MGKKRVVLLKEKYQNIYQDGLIQTVKKYIFEEVLGLVVYLQLQKEVMVIPLREIYVQFHQKVNFLQMFILLN